MYGWEATTWNRRAIGSGLTALPGRLNSGSQENLTTGNILQELRTAWNTMPDGTDGTTIYARRTNFLCAAKTLTRSLPTALFLAKGCARQQKDAACSSIRLQSTPVQFIDVVRILPWERAADLTIFRPVPLSAKQKNQSWFPTEARTAVKVELPASQVDLVLGRVSRMLEAGLSVEMVGGILTPGSSVVKWVSETL